MCKDPRAEARLAGASVTPFRQHKGVCSAHVAKWLRHRGKGDHYFPAATQSNKRFVWFDPAKRHTGRDAFEKKVEDRFAKTEAIDQKQAALGQEVKPQTRYHHTNQYIAKDNRLAYVSTDGPAPLSGFEDTVQFNEMLAREKKVPTLFGSVGLTGGGNHAVGLETNTEKDGSFTYFDPNLGVFVFGTTGEFLAWFKLCPPEFNTVQVDWFAAPTDAVLLRLD